MDRLTVMAPPLLVLLLLLLSLCSAAAPRRGGGWWEEGEGEWRPSEEEEKGKGKGRGLFLLHRVEKVVESEGGQVRVVRGQPWPPASFAACREGLMHIGFITMEPKTLFVPQYLDSSITLFVQRGTCCYYYFYLCAWWRIVSFVPDRYEMQSRGIVMMSRGSEGWVYSQGRARGEEAQDGRRPPHRRRLHLLHGQPRQRPEAADHMQRGRLR